MSDQCVGSGERLLVRLTASGDAGEAGADLIGDGRARADHGDRFEKVIGDEAGHVVPAAELREAIELRVQLAEAVAVERRAIHRRRAVERELLLHGELDARELALIVAVTTIVAQTMRKSRRARPLVTSPRCSAGSTFSSSDFRELNGCAMKPSATSPAASIMRGPNPPSQIGGGPYGLGPGLNAGIINVCR